MGRRIRDARRSPAIAVAALALVAALAGTALAGTDATTSAISKKKVKKIATKQANKAIDAALPLGSDAIADGAVTGGKLAAGAVGRGQLAAGAVGRGQIAARAIGPSALGDIVLRTEQRPLNEGSNAIPEANCEPGERLISGGGLTNFGNAGDISMNAARPENGDGTAVQSGEAVQPPGGWSVEFVNAPGGTGNATATAMALCLR
jgi:hypothetical protein